MALVTWQMQKCIHHMTSQTCIFASPFNILVTLSISRHLAGEWVGKLAVMLSCITSPTQTCTWPPCELTQVLPCKKKRKHKQNMLGKTPFNDGIVNAPLDYGIHHNILPIVNSSNAYAACTGNMMVHFVDIALCIVELHGWPGHTRNIIFPFLGFYHFIPVESSTLGYVHAPDFGPSLISGSHCKTSDSSHTGFRTSCTIWISGIATSYVSFQWPHMLSN